MMKRIFAVLLLGCLFCLALAGCGKTDLQKSQDYLDNHPLKEKKLYSVSFCLVSDDEIDPVVRNKMEEKFNGYTEANYNTHVVFEYKTIAEYAEWLEQKFVAVEAADAARREAEEANAPSTDGTGSVPATAAPETTAAKTELAAAAGTGVAGSIGSDIREVYPEIREDQFDIIYVADYDMFCSLVEKERLRDLTEELTVEYRPYSTKTDLDLFKSAMVKDKIYAVPNSRVMGNGEYEYLCVKIETAQHYNYQFQNNISDESSINMLKKGIIADGGDPADSIKENVPGDYALRYELAEPDENGNDTWWVYTRIKGKTPSINKSDLMDGMFAVTAYAYVDDNGTKTTDADDFCPAVKILHAIQTNPELHTGLRYGAEGLTYSLEKVYYNDEVITVVKTLTDTDFTYDVDPKYTGNSFATYPTREEYDNGSIGFKWKQYQETKITNDIKEFKIEISQPKDAGCTVTTNTTFARNGQIVKMTAVPAAGYEVTGWVIKAESETDTDTSISDDPNALTCEYEVDNRLTGTIKVTFEKIGAATEAQDADPAPEE